MPRFHRGARPVLGYSRSRTVARARARLHGRHVAVVAHQAATAGLSVHSGERFYLIDRRRQTLRAEIALPAARTERRWLTMTVEWWIHDPYLLLTTAPSDAPRQLRHDIIRAVIALARVSPSQELLAVRRFVEDSLRGATGSTSSGCSWKLDAVRANAIPAGRGWRTAVDAWLHCHLRDPSSEDPSTVADKADRGS